MMNFGSIPFVAQATPSGGGPTYIRFSTLSAMTESGSGGTGWIYTGTSGSGNAGDADWSLASGVAGGFSVQVTDGGAIPVCGMYTTATGVWDGSVFLNAYPFSGEWVVESAGFVNQVDTVRTYEANDHLRYTFDTTTGFTVEIARAATPTTWLVLGSGTLTRSATVYPRCHSFNAAGSVFTAPRVN